MYKKYYLLGIIYLVWGWMMVIPDNRVKVVFCNVGQGDAAIVTSGYFQMLIDTGPKKGNVEKCLEENMPVGDKKLEIVLLSHWDSDHFGALDNLLKFYKINKIIGGEGIVGGDEKKYMVEKVSTGDVIIGQNFKFEVIFPDVGLAERNNDSIVGILKFADKSILFTGDIDELVEKSIVDRIKGPIDVVKLAHHGSKTGNSELWLEKINANFAVVSVGKNSYGHPAPEVLGRVLGVGTSVLRTDENGSMVVE